jgi:integrase
MQDTETQAPAKSRRPPLEQRQAHRRQAAATAKARAVDPHQAPNRRPQTRLGDVQFGNRQRAARLRYRRPQGRGCRGSPLCHQRATVRQKKTGLPVRFEVTEQTRQAVDDYIRAADKKPGEFLFAAPRRLGHGLSTRQYARLVGEWIRGIGLDPCMFGTHSLRRTKATLIYRRTGNLRAVQLLLGHHKIESTVRYLGIEVDDALAIAEQIDV